MVKTVFKSMELHEVSVSPGGMALYIYKDRKRVKKISDIHIGGVLIEDESRRIASFGGSDEYSGMVYDVTEIRLTDKDEWGHQAVILNKGSPTSLIHFLEE